VTPADWAWIGGLFDALFPAWYHGVPWSGHRGKKFEPQAAMQLMADHGVRNVFLPPTALKADAQVGVRNAGVNLRSMLTAANRSAPNSWTGARDLRHRCPRSVRPDRMQSPWSATTQNCFDPAGIDGPRDPGFDVRDSAMSRGEKCRGSERGIIGVRQPNPCTMIELLDNPEATARKYGRTIPGHRRSRQTG